MELIDRQRQALALIRESLRDFVSCKTDIQAFMTSYKKLFGPFDPPDLSTDDLSDHERRELGIYIRLMGGWFGEFQEMIPLRDDWKYGRDTEPYSWIDADAYRQWIRQETQSIGMP